MLTSWSRVCMPSHSHSRPKINSYPSLTRSKWTTLSPLTMVATSATHQHQSTRRAACGITRPIHRQLCSLAIKRKTNSMRSPSSISSNSNNSSSCHRWCSRWRRSLTPKCSCRCNSSNLSSLSSNSSFSNRLTWWRLQQLSKTNLIPRCSLIPRLVLTRCLASTLSHSVHHSSNNCRWTREGPRWTSSVRMVSVVYRWWCLLISRLLGANHHRIYCLSSSFPAVYVTRTQTGFKDSKWRTSLGKTLPCQPVSGPEPTLMDTRFRRTHRIRSGTRTFQWRHRPVYSHSPNSRQVSNGHPKWILWAKTPK